MKRHCKNPAVSAATRAGAFRLVSGLALLAAGAGPHGGLRVMAEHIEVLGPRVWLGLMAGNAFPKAPAQRLTRALRRKPVTAGEGAIAA